MRRNKGTSDNFTERTIRFKKFIWQDTEIKFDVKTSDLRKRGGEFQIDSMNSVEDTKGNNGYRGFLIVTNLRLIWASHSNASTNLSIGFSCIKSCNIKKTASKLKGKFDLV